MKWYSTDLDGLTEVDPDAKQRRAVLWEAERHGAEAAYPEVFLGAAGVGTVSYRVGGLMIWEQETGGMELLLRVAGPGEAEPVWEAVARRDLEALGSYSWEPLAESE